MLSVFCVTFCVFAACYIVNFALECHSVHNLDVMCNPQNEKTPMDIAVEKGHKDIIEVLKNAQRKVRCTCTIIRPTFTVCDRRYVNA